MPNGRDAAASDTPALAHRMRGMGGGGPAVALRPHSGPSAGRRGGPAPAGCRVRRQPAGASETAALHAAAHDEAAGTEGAGRQGGDAASAGSTAAVGIAPACARERSRSRAAAATCVMAHPGPIRAHPASFHASVQPSGGPLRLGLDMDRRESYAFTRAIWSPVPPKQERPPRVPGRILLRQRLGRMLSGAAAMGGLDLQRRAAVPGTFKSARFETRTGMLIFSENGYKRLCSTGRGQGFAASEFSADDAALRADGGGWRALSGAQPRAGCGPAWNASLRVCARLFRRHTSCEDPRRAGLRQPVRGIGVRRVLLISTPLRRGSCGRLIGMSHG